MNAIVDFLLQPLVSPAAAALVLGAVAFVLARWAPAVCRWLSLAGSVVVLAAGLRLVGGDSNETVHWMWVQDLARDVWFSLDLAATTLGLLVVVGSAAFGVLVSVYAHRALAGTEREGRFHAYLLWTLAGTSLVGLAGNLAVLLVGWEFVTLMLYLMINLGRGEARAGAARAFGMLGFADACLLLGVAFLAALPGGSAEWAIDRAPLVLADQGALAHAAYVLILVAALAKAGAMPLHTWIPGAARDAPVPVLAFLPAALDKLLGIYLLALTSLRLFTPGWTFQVVLMAVGAVTILAAVIMAMMQHDLRRLLSFHAVSQVGYMVLGIGTGTVIGVVGGLFHMVNNALYKCNLFFMNGTVERAAGTDEVEDLGGLARLLPVTFACSVISAAAIAGVPPLNGFVSKWLVYQGTLELGRPALGHPGLAIALVTVAVFGSALTLASFVKVIYAAFLSPAPRVTRRHPGRPRESFWLAAPMVVLAAACVVLGLFPELLLDPVLVPAVAATAAVGEPVAAGVQGVTTGSLGLWQAVPATVLILVGLLGGLGFLWVAAQGRRVRVVRPFLAGEVPAPADDRFRVPGTHLYETIRKLPGLGPWIHHAEHQAVDLYYWSGRHGRSFVDLLRGWHTGLISLYVAWCVLGLTITLAYLLIHVRT